MSNHPEGELPTRSDPAQPLSPWARSAGADSAAQPAPGSTPYAGAALPGGPAPGQQPPVPPAQYGPGWQAGVAQPATYATGYPAPPSAPPGAPPSAPPRRRTGLIIALIAGALVLALVAAAAVWFLVGNRRPGAVRGIPSAALAVAQVDLNPALADQLAVKAFVEKFPGARARQVSAASDYKSALWAALNDGGSEINYATDIAPWLGDSIAVGMLEGPAGGSPSYVVSVAVTDQGKAQAFVAKHLPSNKVQFFEDLMLLTQGDTPLDTASLKGSSVVDSRDYAADMQRLQGRPLVSMWMTSQALTKLVSQFGGLAAGNTEFMPDAHGAAGLTVADGVATLRSVATSAEAQPTLPSAYPLVSSLPASATVGAALGMSEAGCAAAWRTASKELENSGLTQDNLCAALGSGGSVIFNAESSEFAARVASPSPAKTQAVWEDLLKRSYRTPEVQTATGADAFYVGTGQAFDQIQAPAAKLGDSAEFQRLTKDATDAPFIAFVNPAQIADALSDIDASAAENVAAITGVAVFSRRLDDHTGEGILRVGT